MLLPDDSARQVDSSKTGAPNVGLRNAVTPKTGSSGPGLTLPASTFLRDSELRTFRGLTGAIGILGASLDPITLGHTFCAEMAQQGCPKLGLPILDTVVFVPTPYNPLKAHRPGATPEQRLHMTKLAIDDRPSWMVSAEELRRDRQQPTALFLRDVRAQIAVGAQLFFIMGTDTLARLPEWKMAELLLDSARPIVVNRGEVSQETWDRIEARLGTASLEKIRQSVLDNQPFLTSSSEVRRQLSQEVSRLNLAARVQQYVTDARLYETNS